MPKPTSGSASAAMTPSVARQVAEDVDAFAAPGSRLFSSSRDVVADQQRDRAGFGEDLTVRDDARSASGLLLARCCFQRSVPSRCRSVRRSSSEVRRFAHRECGCRPCRCGRARAAGPRRSRSGRCGVASGRRRRRPASARATAEPRRESISRSLPDAPMLAPAPLASRSMVLPITLASVVAAAVIIRGVEDRAVDRAQARRSRVVWTVSTSIGPMQLVEEDAACDRVVNSRLSKALSTPVAVVAVDVDFEEVGGTGRCRPRSRPASGVGDAGSHA